MASLIYIFGVLTAVAVCPAITAEDEVVTICQSEAEEVSCPENHALTFKAATFGRTESPTECPAKQDDEMNCEENVLSEVRDMCKSGRSCNLEATSELLGGDPCSNSTKYLKATYQCVPELRSITCEGRSGWNEDNRTMNIQCDDDAPIRYLWANYGRLESEKDLCSTERTDCDYSSDTNTKVKRICNGKRSCSVEATNQELGNNCAEINTYKYLEIIYGCVDRNNRKQDPARNKTVIKCERSPANRDFTADLRCTGGGKVIKILWANWGRLRSYSEECEPEYPQPSCRTRNTILYLIAACGENNSTCSIQATNENFGGDPCPGVYKYLEVHYFCEAPASIPASKALKPQGLPLVMLAMLFMALRS